MEIERLNQKVAYAPPPNLFIIIISEPGSKLEIQFQNSTNACLPSKKLEIQNLIVSGRLELRNINIE